MALKLVGVPCLLFNAKVTLYQVVKEGNEFSMQLLTKLSTIFDRTILFLVIIASLMLMFMVGAVTAEVLNRLIFGQSIIWVPRITEILLLFIPFLAAAWLLKRDRHVKMDILLNRLTSKTRLKLNVVNYVISALVCAILVWYGVQVTWSSYQKGLYEITVLEIPKAATIWIIPFGSLILFIQFLRSSYGYFRALRKH